MIKKFPIKFNKNRSLIVLVLFFILISAIFIFIISFSKNNNPLIGKWKFDGEYEYEYNFNEDLTCDFTGIPCTYSTENGVVKILYDGMTEPLEAKIDNNRLIIESIDDDLVYLHQ